MTNAHIAYIALGANLNNPKKQLKTALSSLNTLPHTEVIKVSSLYQSPPFDNSDQPDYINTVAKITTKLSALTLLDACQHIEHSQGRERLRKWGARTIDLDIILFGNEVIKTTRLTVPHYNMNERDFVLLPLYEIEPELILPTMEKLTTLIEQLPPIRLQKCPSITLL